MPKRVCVTEQHKWVSADRCNTRADDVANPGLRVQRGEHVWKWCAHLSVNYCDKSHDLCHNSDWCVFYPQHVSVRNTLMRT